MSGLSNPPESGRNKFIFGSLLIAFLVVLIRTAWLCDDAYITFRVIDNFVNGYGLVWNISERVQVFTHPLWMLLLSGVYVISREIYFTSIFVSILIGLVTVYVVGFRISISTAQASIALLILMVSKAFVEYSTSGLENPLTFLLLALFYWQFLKNEFDLRKLLILSTIAGLGTLNRFDTLLLFLPALIYAYIKVPKWRGALIVLSGFLPLIVWIGFSLIYYGFPLPNTYYAKLHTGVSPPELWLQGLKYLLYALQFDSITLIVIVIGLVLAFQSKNWKFYAGGAGVLLYLLYVVKIGGDFMGGRFLAAPLLCTVIFFAARPIYWSGRKLGIVAALIAAYGILWPGSVLTSGRNFGINRDGVVGTFGIADERRFYYHGTGLLLAEQNNAKPNFFYHRWGEKWRSEGKKVKVIGAVGFCGFAAGPNVHIIDEHALTDPLLARLPVYNKKVWRIGHFKRMIPKGYVETNETSENKVDDSNLADYYDILKIIIGGEIFNKDRLFEIYRMNLGYYDSLIDKYQAAAMRETPYDSINVPKTTGTMWRLGGNADLNLNGLRILFDSTCHARVIEISVDNNDQYKFVFYDGTAILSEYLIDSLIIPSGGLRVDTVEVPAVAYENGYDIIEVHPSGPDECYSVGHVLLLSAGESGSSIDTK